jgi:hypothetical protein
MHFSVNESKRYLITLHLSLNDLLRRIILHNSFFTELVEQETKLTIKTKTKFAAAFERTVALKTQDPDKTILLLFLFLRRTRLILCFFYFICHSYILFIIKCN